MDGWMNGWMASRCEEVCVEAAENVSIVNKPHNRLTNKPIYKDKINQLRMGKN